MPAVSLLTLPRAWVLLSVGIWGLPWCLRQCRTLLPMQETWVRSLHREDPLRREWQPTPVFLPGESHGQRSLVGYSPWGRTESDTTETLTLWLLRERYLFLVWIWPPEYCWVASIAEIQSPRVSVGRWYVEKSSVIKHPLDAFLLWILFHSSSSTECLFLRKVCLFLWAGSGGWHLSNGPVHLSIFLQSPYQSLAFWNIHLSPLALSSTSTEHVSLTVDVVSLGPSWVQGI